MLQSQLTFYQEKKLKAHTHVHTHILTLKQQFLILENTQNCDMNSSLAG